MKGFRIPPTQETSGNHSDCTRRCKRPTEDNEMHHSLHIVQYTQFGHRELQMSDADLMDDVSLSGYLQNPTTTIDDCPIWSWRTPVYSGQEEELSGPMIDRNKNDPMLTSYCDDYSKHSNKNKEAARFDKVVVEYIKNEEFSEAINHLEDHSYYQNMNESVVDSDKSVSSGSSSSSESEEIDVEHTEPEPTKQTWKCRLKRNAKLQSTKNIRTTVPAKKARGKSYKGKSYHNEVERKRRQQQRRCLDNLRRTLELPARAPKMRILAIAREEIIQLKTTDEIIQTTLKEEKNLKINLLSKLAELMKRD